MEKRLVFYIQDALDKGYTLPQIKKSLLDSGHKNNIIDSAIDKINNPHSSFHTKDDFQSRSLQNIERDLKSFKKPQKGMGEKIIKKAIDDVRYGAHYDDLKKTFKKFLVPISLVVLFLIIINISIFTRTSLMLIIIAFMPTIISIPASFLVFNKLKDMLFIWLVPVLIVIIFYFTIEGMEKYKIAVLNVILSWLFITVMIYNRNPGVTNKL